MHEPQVLNEPQIPADPRKTLDLGRLLGQRRAFVPPSPDAVPPPMPLRRIHDERLYLPHAATWEEFCGPNLAVSRRHADRLISLLNRFGPISFELSQFVGPSPQDYLVDGILWRVGNQHGAPVAPYTGATGGLPTRRRLTTCPT
jgi:hypothetical protein